MNSLKNFKWFTQIALFTDKCCWWSAKTREPQHCRLGALRINNQANKPSYQMECYYFFIFTFR